MNRTQLCFKITPLNQLKQVEGPSIFDASMCLLCSPVKIMVFFSIKNRKRFQRKYIISSKQKSKSYHVLRIDRTQTCNVKLSDYICGITWNKFSTDKRKSISHELKILKSKDYCAYRGRLSGSTACHRRAIMCQGFWRKSDIDRKNMEIFLRMTLAVDTSTYDHKTYFNKYSF